jgi:Fur family transcriptional regulator, ferric uptake regulator
MTHAPRTTPLVADSVDDVIAALRARGGRLTAPRRALLEALFAADGPASAEHLARGLDVDPATAYRTLEHLQELGVARHVHLGHGPGLWALARSPEHEYLTCERCGAVAIVEARELDGVRAAIRERFGYEARFDHFPIVGLCRACAAGQAPRHGAVHSHGDHIHSHPHGHEH